MTTHLKITTVFKGERTETRGSDWPGWDLEAAASVMRAQHRVDGGGLVYDLPVGGRHREAGIVRVVHEWSDSERVVDDASVAVS
ncbi:hypothetical protein [Brachybacterium sacelli]|uniref:Uncharacterized protein n=1 Tax=Brachybacterium sacelli TaxID=173364 RepID=A0ABS4X5M8_9MICO|nr:hypothetical protein [Brachybacterium sacelli]MBP2383767.1 hypothetical protein [Brachybacterium sacelli]